MLLNSVWRSIFKHFGCGQFCKSVLFINDLFETNYSKRLRQPYIDLRHRVHLTHQNLISKFLKFREKHFGFQMVPYNRSVIQKAPPCRRPSVDLNLSDRLWVKLKGFALPSTRQIYVQGGPKYRWGPAPVRRENI